MRSMGLFPSDGWEGRISSRPLSWFVGAVGILPVFLSVSNFPFFIRTRVIWMRAHECFHFNLITSIKSLSLNKATFVSSRGQYRNCGGQGAHRSTQNTG